MNIVKQKAKLNSSFNVTRMTVGVAVISRLACSIQQQVGSYSAAGSTMAAFIIFLVRGQRHLTFSDKKVICYMVAKNIIDCNGRLHRANSHFMQG